MRNRLDRITIRGFKTIADLENFEPRALTALIGPNGVGKSNFIAFFRMMSWALADPAICGSSSVSVEAPASSSTTVPAAPARSKPS